MKNNRKKVAASFTHYIANIKLKALLIGFSILFSKLNTVFSLIKASIQEQIHSLVVDLDLLKLSDL
jgi:hypothetical protein